MKHLESSKNWFLLLFLLGLILLGLFGYGKYSYGLFGRKITPPNSAILIFAIPMLLPYIVITFIQLRQNKTVEEKIEKITDTNVEKLLRDGVGIEIIFEEAVTDLYETTLEKNSDIELLKSELLFPYSNLYDSRDEVITIVTLQYTVKNETYIKKVVFPYTKKNTEICLKFQKCTKLYYEKNDPQNAVVDLHFLS